MKKLNLGCGTDIRKDYINIDFINGNGVDIVHNLNQTPYPFEDDYFDEIYASHVLEHLDGDWFKIIKELYRIMKRGGRLLIKVPHFTSATAFIENHRRFFRYRSFETFEDQKTLKALDQIDYYKFKIVSRKIIFNKWPLFYNYPIELFSNINKTAAIIYENTFLRSLFPAEELVFELKKI